MDQAIIVQIAVFLLGSEIGLYLNDLSALSKA
jgi:hypothetical protein